MWAFFFREGLELKRGEKSDPSRDQRERLSTVLHHGQHVKSAQRPLGILRANRSEQERRSRKSRCTLLTRFRRRRRMEIWKILAIVSFGLWSARLSVRRSL